MSIANRKRLLLLLIAVFFCQTAFVYLDPELRKAPPLSEAGLRGWKVWHGNNCQSCHQVFGFGGFLGPDLTNIHRTLTRIRLDAIMGAGSGQMPAFHLPEQERSDLAVFFEELDKTGVGQVKARKGRSANEVLVDFIDAANGDMEEMSPATERGRKIFLEQNCIDCHLPNLLSAYKASDLTKVSDKLGKKRVLSTLANGVPGKAMPRFNFSTADGEAVFAFLAWIEKRGPALRSVYETEKKKSSGGLFSLPWFEY